jgi:hypothetical protein
VFGVDENCLFVKKMPRRTYSSEDEFTLPSQNPMKEWLTSLLGSNASNVYKLKHMPVYHYDSPRVFTQQKVIRGELGLYGSPAIKHVLLGRIFMLNFPSSE